MQAQTHLLSSLALAALRYPRRPLAAAALVLAGTLIDIDHFVLYALQTGDWSISGALRYNRYRHLQRVRGDTRPRYGPLRSFLHLPWLVLPPLWLAALRRQAWQPIALGLSLHLALDYLDWPRYRRAMRQAGGRCAACGQSGRKLMVVVRQRDRQWRYEAQCRPCREQFVADAAPPRPK